MFVCKGRERETDAADDNALRVSLPDDGVHHDISQGEEEVPHHRPLCGSW
jgi:hypothetical protein